MTHSYVCHDAIICVPWLTHMCATNHSYMWHDSVTRVTHTCDMTHSYVWHDWFIYETRLAANSSYSWPPSALIWCDTTPSYVCHDSIICVPWLIYMCAMTHSDMWQPSPEDSSWSWPSSPSIRCIWLTYTCTMTHSYVCHDSFTHVTW